jgi:hypothetical protein
VNAPCRAHQKEKPVEIPPAFLRHDDFAKLLLHFLHEHCFAFVSGGFGSASGGLCLLSGCFSGSGAGGAGLLNGLGLVESCLTKVGALLAIICAGATGNHGESQCHHKQNCHYSLHNSFLLKKPIETKDQITSPQYNT